jgi:hypothetical protein
MPQQPPAPRLTVGRLRRSNRVSARAFGSPPGPWPFLRGVGAGDMAPPTRNRALGRLALGDAADRSCGSCQAGVGAT